MSIVQLLWAALHAVGCFCSSALSAVSTTTMAIVAAIANEVAAFKGVLAPAAYVLGMGAVAGVIPRVGPGRALVLGWSSVLFPVRTSLSQRASEVEALRSKMASARDDQYCIVQGPKGVGKSPVRAVRPYGGSPLPPPHTRMPTHPRRFAGETCLVDTATRRMPGVVRVRVPPNTLENIIVSNALRAVARMRSPLIFDSARSAHRVAWWHRGTASSSTCRPPLFCGCQRCTLAPLPRNLLARAVR